VNTSQSFFNLTARLFVGVCVGVLVKVGVVVFVGVGVGEDVFVGVKVGVTEGVGVGQLTDALEKSFVTPFDGLV
jgi:hypothetical protein